MFPNRKPTHYRNIYLDNQIYFFTSSIVQFQPVLLEDNLKQCILKYWNLYRKKYSIKIHGYVLMPNHFHILFYGEKANHVKSFMQQSLRSSAIAIVTEIQRWPRERKETILKVFLEEADQRTNYKVWKEQTRGIPLDSEDMVTQRLNYIHENPLRKGLVHNPLDYLYSSYRNYELGDQSVFHIDLL